MIFIFLDILSVIALKISNFGYNLQIDSLTRRYIKHNKKNSVYDKHSHLFLIRCMFGIVFFSFRDSLSLLMSFTID